VQFAYHVILDNIVAQEVNSVQVLEMGNLKPYIVSFSGKC